MSLVPSGEEAVGAAERTALDLVVLDMILGKGMDGVDTFQVIRRHRPGQKTLIISGFSESWRDKEAQRLSAGAYLKKPFRIADLAVAARKAVQEAPTRGPSEGGPDDGGRAAVDAA